jgi:hypothetical protein
MKSLCEAPEDFIFGSFFCFVKASGFVDASELVELTELPRVYFVADEKTRRLN